MQSVKELHIETGTLISNRDSNQQHKEHRPSLLMRSCLCLIIAFVLMTFIQLVGPSVLCSCQNVDKSCLLTSLHTWNAVVDASPQCVDHFTFWSLVTLGWAGEERLCAYQTTV